MLTIFSNIIWTISGCRLHTYRSKNKQSTSHHEQQAWGSLGTGKYEQMNITFHLKKGIAEI